MLNWIHDRFYFLLLFGDLMLTELALGLANALRYRLSWGKPIGPGQVYVTLDVCLIIPALWFCAFRIARVYQRGILADRSAEAKALVSGVALGAVSFAGYLFFTHKDDFSRLLLLYFVLFDLGLLSALRYLGYRLLPFLQANGFVARRLLIVGCGQLGQRIAHRLHNGSVYGLQIAGFARDGSEVAGEDDAPLEFPLLGPSEELGQIVRRHEIKGVVITTSARQEETLSAMLEALQHMEVTVQIAAEALYPPGSYIPLEDIRGIPLIAVQGPVLSLLDRVEKRVLDLLLATLGLLLSLPLVPLIALLIVIDSPGPVFFVQERIGKRGRPFKLVKFRSMVVGAEEMLPSLVCLENLDQPVFKIRNDPRVTRVGRILRRTGLDEIPQWLNVFKGDMSLVGPRPEERLMVERYRHWHRQRLLVKPGITGAMQINGRGDLALDERIRLELAYIRNYSLFEDIRILLATVPAIVSGRGAF